jgi:hypothetical protein
MDATIENIQSLIFRNNFRDKLPGNRQDTSARARLNAYNHLFYGITIVIKNTRFVYI